MQSTPLFDGHHAAQLRVFAEALKVDEFDNAAGRIFLDSLGKTALSEDYAEVELLRLIYRIRSIARYFSSSPEMSWNDVKTTLGQMFDLLPDEVFFRLQELMKRLDFRDEYALCLLQEVVRVVNAVQSELLRATHNLTMRCESLTVVFQTEFPFAQLQQS